MIKISCLSCGHTMELGEAYEEYQGEVRCWRCREVLTVKLRDGKLQSIQLRAPGATPEKPLGFLAGR